MISGLQRLGRQIERASGMARVGPGAGAVRMSGFPIGLAEIGDRKPARERGSLTDGAG